jgi:hypothetical protein
VKKLGGIAVILTAVAAAGFRYIQGQHQDRLISSDDAIRLLSNCPVFTQGQYFADLHGNLTQQTRHVVSVGPTARDHSSVHGLFHGGANWRYQTASRNSDHNYNSAVTFWHNRDEGSWSIYSFTDEDDKQIEIDGNCTRLKRY